MANQEHGNKELGNKEHDSTGFVVKDRRRFDAQGTLRTLEPGAEKTKVDFSLSNTTIGIGTHSSVILDRSYQPQHEASHLSQPAVKSKTVPTPPPPALEEDDEEGDINFSSFVVSLATQASIQLGLLSPPPGMEAAVDLEAAKQTIDILGLVELKTRGNLNEEEKSLLVNILHELRIGFVQIMKSKKA